MALGLSNSELTRPLIKIKLLSFLFELLILYYQGNTEHTGNYTMFLSTRFSSFK